MRLAALTLLLAACASKDEESDTSPETADSDTDGVVSQWDIDSDGWTIDEGDCADTDPTINPGVTEVPYDGIDNDCSPDTRDDDVDGDGFLRADECDDTRADVYPGAPDPWYDGVDENCDAADDFDQDGDGFPRDADCSDEDANSRPDGPEICDNGIDDNCDGKSNACGWVGDHVPSASAGAMLVGSDARGLLAENLASAGDVDGDGLGDVLVASIVTQLVFVVPGGTSGTTTMVDAVASIGVLDEDDGNSAVGKALLGPGDLDGDGDVEVAVGTPEMGASVGGVYLFAGPVTGMLTAEDATAIWTGEADPDRAGTAITALDRDGVPSIAIGAPQHAAAYVNMGRVYLVSGTTGGSLADADRLEGASGGYTAGAALAGLDYDGDGADDLAVGAPQYFDTTFREPRGAVYLVLGPIADGATLDEADARWHGESNVARAGSVLAPAGDLDGDGREDLLVGASEDVTGVYGHGAAYVLSGGATSGTSLNGATARFYGEADGFSLGNAMAGVGDADGNGLGDFVLADWQYEDGSHVAAGRAYLFDGAPAGMVDLAAANATFTGEADSEHFGSAVAGLGDFSGDGRPDFAVGSPFDAEAAFWGGTAFVFYGESW